MVQSPWIPLARPLWLVLATVAVIALFVGLRVALPIYFQKSAIRKIKDLGGDAFTSAGGPEWLRNQVGNEWMKVFDNVTEVWLTGREAVTDADLKLVNWLPKLRGLRLSGRIGGGPHVM